MTPEERLLAIMNEIESLDLEIADMENDLDNLRIQREDRMAAYKKHLPHCAAWVRPIIEKALETA